MKKKIIISGICFIVIILAGIYLCLINKSDGQQEKMLIPEGMARIDRLILKITISTKIVTDEECQSISNWREKVSALTKEVSGMYEKEFGICLEIGEFIPWDSPDLEPIEEGWHDLSGTQWLIDDAAEEVPSEGNLTIVFTGENLENRYPGMSLKTERRGMPEYYVLVWINSSNPRNHLIHEIAHIFGACHPYEEWGWEYNNEFPSVMDPGQGSEIADFDPRNWEIVFNNRSLLIS